MHADAQQMANLLFTKGKGGKPALNEAAKKANIDIGSFDGKQIGISGHSLGGAPTPPNTVPLTGILVFVVWHTPLYRILKAVCCRQR